MLPAAAGTRRGVMMNLSHLYTSFEGRIGRQSWWIGIVGLLVIGIVGVLVIDGLLDLGSTAGLVVFLLFELALVYPAYCLMGKRFQDRNRPAIYGLIGIVVLLAIAHLDFFGIAHDATGWPTPIGWVGSLIQLIVGIWFLVELGFLRGTVGPNRYGADPV